LGLRTGLDAVAKEKSHCLCREFNLDRPTRSLVTILSQFPRLILGYKSRFIFSY